jgi:putative NIF3 family GTP cyclohydrolase 1 type 2
VYLTGDVSYSNARAAADMGLNLIIAPHFASEVLVITY